jgi:hypothetical protein
MSKNLNSELKKEENYTCDPSKRMVEGSSGALGRGPYGERSADYTNYVIICYQIELDKLNIYKTLTCSILKMCWWLCMRLCIISSQRLSLSSAALSLVAREE